MNTEFDRKRDLQLLADAASAIQLRQWARTNSGWYFALASIVLIPSLVQIPASLGFGWLACVGGLMVAGICGFSGSDLNFILWFRVAITLAVACFSVFSLFLPTQYIGTLIAIFAISLSVSGLRALKDRGRLKVTPPEVQAKVLHSFHKAIQADPEKTPGLIALRRIAGLNALWADL